MQIKDVLVKNNFRFNKAFGQNFLTDENLLDGIVISSGVTERDTVLEIGVGAGTLTRSISQKAKKVYGYEIDRNLQPVLKESLSGINNVEIIFKDVMREKTDELENKISEPYYLIANLPYYITTPLIMKFVDDAKNCKGITVMVQEEVALRLCAKAGTPDYGAITVGIDAFCDAEIVMKVPRTKFYPQPNVDSAVVKITFNSGKYDVLDKEKFRAVVRSAFSSRRKTLVNNLMQSFSFTRSKAEELLQSVGVDVMSRGETLTTGQFVNLANCLTKEK